MARNFEFAYDLSGNNTPPAIRRLPVAATQTIAIGDALVLSSGRVARADTAVGEVVGVAAQDADGLAQGTLIEVQVAMPWHAWRAVATADATSVVRDGTETYDLQTSTQLVNVADTTGGSLQIIDIDPDVNTEIYVRFTKCYFAI